MAEEWLLVKRGLYYRPEGIGYTGIRDNAGRYSREEAESTIGPEVTMVRLEDAPEFTDACFEDLARDHLRKQLDAALALVATIKREIGTWDMEGPDGLTTVGEFIDATLSSSTTKAAA
jgi:hypothetical protein